MPIISAIRSSDAYIAAERAAAEDDLKRLHAIDKTKLSHVDQHRL